MTAKFNFQLAKNLLNLCHKRQRRGLRFDQRTLDRERQGLSLGRRVSWWHRGNLGQIF